MRIIRNIMVTFKKLSSQLFFVYLIGVVLTVSIILGTINEQYKTAYGQMASQYGNGVLSRLSVDLEGYLHNLIDTSNLIVYDSKLMHYIENGFPVPYNELQVLDLSNLTDLAAYSSQITNSGYDIQRMFLFCSYGKAFYKASSIPDRTITKLLDNNGYTDTDWYHAAEAANGKSIIIRHADGFPSSEFTFYITKLLKNISTGKIIGCLLLEVSEETIQNLCKDYEIPEKQEYIVAIDRVNGLSFSSSTNDAAVYLLNNHVDSQSDQGNNVLNIAGKDYYVSWIMTRDFHLELFHLNLMANVTMAQVNSIKLTLVVAVFCLLVSFICVRIVVQHLTKPIEQLQAGMQKVECGDFSVRLEPKRQNELSKLFVSFNHMVAQIEALVQKVYVETMQRQQAQLVALQQQINPHFLYNTLDSIQMTALMQKDFKVSRMITMLANMFRYVLSEHFEQVTVEEELAYTMNYIELQQVRYDNLFSVENYIPSSLMHMPILKVTLQPLIENSIYHGFNNSTGNKIILNADQTEKGYWISVEDDGVGIECGVLDHIKDSLKQNTAESKYMGILNVNRRLKYAFGQESGIEINSVLGSGTKTVINIVWSNDEY